MHKRISTGRRRLRALAALATSVAAGGLVTATAAAPALAAPAAAPAGVPAAGGTVSAGGPVSGTSCSAGCDLYAKAGTATVGATALPVWNFTVGDSTVTGANPVIVATKGDTVTIRLHNTLSVPVALTIPGLAAVRTDYAGVAPNATKTYTFAASRVGTFVYQAGRITTSGANDPGPREVAMGLAGGLVIRPAAAGQDLEGALPVSAFDDEAVLVLSEVDPVFAANPLTADLRAFDPTYRLINGSAWPATTQIGTTAGHKVLLRYVNAGVTSASMGVLGLKQSLVAQNAYASTGAALVADTIAAGDTEDTLVTIPAGGGNFPVVDSSGRLDTAGQVDGSANRQLAFGGRMTMLSTTGGVGGSTDPGGDTVGPNTTNIAFSPNPAPANTDVTVSATFTDPKVTVGTNTYGPNAVAGAEYALDPGIAAGSGTAFTTVTPGTTTGTATGSMVIPATALAGKTSVKVYVRAKDDQGNWGPTATGTINIPNSGPKVTGLSVSPTPTNGQADVTLRATGDDSAIGSTISAMSWAPTGGTCPLADCSMTLDTTGSVVAATATVPASYLQTLPTGTKSLALTVTAKDALGLTGSADVSLTVDQQPPVVSGSSGVEVTPNNGTLGSGVDPTMLKVYATFSDAGLGDSKIVAAEGFFNRTAALSDADNGTGFVFVANDGAFDSPTEPAYGLVPLTELTAVQDGPVSIPVHAEDAAGNWGPTSVITLQVDRTKPALSGLTATQQAGGPGRVQLGFTLANPGTGATNVVAAEYFLGTTDPGAGRGTAVPGLTYPLAAGPVTATLQNLPLGPQTVNVRVKDQAGNWSAPATASLTVLTEPIFSDSFGTFGFTGNSNAWAARTNGLTYPRVNGFDGLFAMLTANGSGNSNVTTPTMTGGTNPPAGSYNARFLFRPNTLSSSGVNILTLRSSTFGQNTQRAAVQFAVNSGVRQFRAVNGTGTVGSWVTLPGTFASTTVYTVKLAWSGAGTGSITVTLANGAATATSTATGGGNGTTVNNAVLGTSGGSVSGQAYFDNYTASRFGMPA